MNNYKQNEAPLDEYAVGVIIGRFQTPKLHEGHIDLFDHVCSRHDRVVVFLGNSPIVDPDNFLDYQQRKAMILEKYPHLQDILYIQDTNENSTWSPRLDELISHQLRPMEKPLLYGSRDSFIKAYMDGNGRYDCEEFEAKQLISATEIRNGLSKKLITGYLVRVGMFLASLMRYPTAYQTVDVAVMDDDRKNIWLGRKKDEKEFRFIGGFSDPRTNSLEEDAIRETMEESHIELSFPQYIFSTLIDDWRYRRSRDKIKTALFIGDRVGGQPKPDDDIVEIRKFPMSDFIWEDGTAPILDVLKNGNKIVDTHHPLMLKLVEYLTKV